MSKSLESLVSSSTGMLIDGIFASEAIDSSGEVLDIKGADISDLEEGKGVLNYEHRGDDAPGASPNDIVGKIVMARKIMSEADCENERQRKYWRQVELPFIYGICRLYDAAGHPGAIAAAAHIRDHVANGEPILARFSIEGSTLSREKQRLTHTVARRVALTFKPCNRSCDSGLLADPNAPEGFKTTAKTDPLEALAEKFEHPGYARIGAGPEFSAYEPLPEDLGKAYTGGSYNAAPGTLTGGAALQVEDPSLRKRFLMNQAKAALRDWDGESDFKKFVKHRLPEADPEFIDRFAALVTDYKLKKKDPAQGRLFSPAEVGEGQLSIRGRPVPPTPAVDKPAFDDRTGILHTPRGSFPMYIPGRDPSPHARAAFHNAMGEAAPSKVHAYALKNWMKVHRLLKAGKIPDAVVMHATLFSQLSPNTPVPMQELMYGHLMDTMRAAGIDARSPKFAKLKDRWVDRDRPDTFPQHSPRHWPTIDDAVRIQDDSDLTGRKAGEIGGFMLANDKFENMASYHRMHRGLMELVQKHRHDARSAVRELMQEKHEFKNHENRRKSAEKAGRPDPGEYQGIPVRGLAPKTARYMYGMMGGGNVVVPDTHFVRHLFGLEKGRDTASIEYIKSLLWHTDNAPLMEGIDRHYAANHDAMKHIAEHPLLAGSSVSPDDMLFPAFWRHWMAIVPHEQARNMRTQGYNEYTDHRPFWEAILDHVSTRVTKASQDDWTTATDTAKEHLHWVETLGEGPALLMYFAFLLPKLLGNSFHILEGSPPESNKEGDLSEVGSQYAVSGDPNGEVDAAAMVRKFESIAIDLSVACEQLRKNATVDPKAVHVKREPVEYQGRKVFPGWLELNPNARQPSEPHGFAVVGSDQTHFHVVPAPKGLRDLKTWAPGDVRRISKLGKDSSYRMHVWPEVADNGHVVDVEKHGHPAFNTDNAQRKLIHGFDFSAEPVQQRDARPGNGSFGEWRKHPDGSVVYVKYNHHPVEFPDTRREVAFHNVARDVFKMGDHLTPTALVKHPRSGRELAIIKRVPGFEHYGIDPDHMKSLHALGRDGTLDKLATMDWVLGQWDRHDGNWGFAPNKAGGHQFKLIDHAHAFVEDPADGMGPPDYLVDYHTLEHPTWRNEHGNPGPEIMQQPMHQDVLPWIQGVKPEQLEQHLRSMEVPERFIHAASQRLKYVQGLAARGRPLLVGEVFDPALTETSKGLAHQDFA